MRNLTFWSGDVLHTYIVYTAVAGSTTLLGWRAMLVYGASSAGWWRSVSSLVDAAVVTIPWMIIIVVFVFSLNRAGWTTLLLLLQRQRVQCEGSRGRRNKVNCFNLTKLALPSPPPSHSHLPPTASLPYSPSIPLPPYSSPCPLHLPLPYPYHLTSPLLRHIHCNPVTVAIRQGC